MVSRAAVSAQPASRARTPQRPRQKSQVDPRVRQHAKEMFRRFDRDNNGTISKVEAQRMLEEMQLDVSGGYIDGVWGVYDVNGDGVLDQDEFSKFVQVLVSRSQSQIRVAPSNWEEHFSVQHQRPYYINAATNERTWVRPARSDHATSTSASTSATTWIQRFSQKHKRPYYINTVTNERTWVQPAAMQP